MTKIACAQVCKVAHRYDKLSLTRGEQWWERSSSVRQTVAWYPGNARGKGSTGTVRLRIISSGTPCSGRTVTMGSLLTYTTHYIPTYCVHTRPHKHAWTCVFIQNARASSADTNMLESHKTPRVISRCLVEYKHSGAAQLADWKFTLDGSRSSGANFSTLSWESSTWLKKNTRSSILYLPLSCVCVWTLVCTCERSAGPPLDTQQFLGRGGPGV